MDTARLINPHTLIIGSSGVGKSYTIRRMINEAFKNSKVRFHVFDVHGDLEIPGASVVQFSEQAPYGLNPLKVNPDPEWGGVRKCIQGFMRTINQATAQLGVKQESVLRNLLEDVLRDFGFQSDNIASWSVNEYDACLVSSGRDNRIYLTVPIAEKDEAKGLGARWDPERKLWWMHTESYRGVAAERWKPAYKERRQPGLADVLAYAKRVHEERFLGSDQKAVRALHALNKQAKAMQRRMLDAVKQQRVNETESADKEALEAAREKAIEAFTEYVSTIRTGEEFDNLLKYESSDVLKSVVDRLGNLNATGIFKQALPPFDPSCQVWRYKLNALSAEEKKMFVLFQLQELFSRAVQNGEQTEVQDIIVLDELSTYTSTQDDDGDGIIGVIAREARKYGLGLWAANQTPTGVPESLLSSTATKIVLGIDEMYWTQAVTKLRIENKLLEWIRPHHTMAVQLKEKGSLKNRWWWVQLPRG